MLFFFGNKLYLRPLQLCIPLSIGLYIFFFFFFFFVQIKFVPNRPGMILVQMCDANAAAAVVTALNGVVLYGHPVEMLISKHPEIKDSSRQESLPDGTPVARTKIS